MLCAELPNFTPSGSHLPEALIDRRRCSLVAVVLPSSSSSALWECPDSY